MIGGQQIPQKNSGYLVPPGRHGARYTRLAGPRHINGHLTLALTTGRKYASGNIYRLL